MIKIEIKSVSGPQSKIPIWMLVVIIVSSLMIITMICLKRDRDSKFNEFEIDLNWVCPDSRKMVSEAILSYIKESGDDRLTFDTGLSIQDIDVLLDDLQKEITYKGHKYGPFLNNALNNQMKDYFKKTILGNDKAVRINIHVKSKRIDISPDTKNGITYFED